MKKIISLFSIFLLFACSSSSDNQDLNNSSGNNSNNNSAPIYLDSNGITIKARDWAKVGDAAVINGKSYVVADRQMIIDATNLKEDLSLFCTTKLTTMAGLFKNKDLNVGRRQNINNWDVSNVTNMSYMFQESVYYGDFDAWDVSNVTDMSYMFYRVQGLLQDSGMENWDVSKVQNMSFMFERCWLVPDGIGFWDVSNVTNMDYMFKETGTNKSIENWKTTNVVSMWGMFVAARNFNQDLSGWDVSNVIRCGSFSNLTDNWTLPKPNFTNCNPD